jgi:hypothetical protein
VFVGVNENAAINDVDGSIQVRDAAGQTGIEGGRNLVAASG